MNSRVDMPVTCKLSSQLTRNVCMSVENSALQQPKSVIQSSDSLLQCIIISSIVDSSIILRVTFTNSRTHARIIGNTYAILLPFRYISSLKKAKLKMS